MRWLVLAVALLVPQVVSAGLAASYPGDIGIGSDPAVVFSDNFEYADTAALLASANWGTIQNGVTLGTSAPAPSSGTKSARLDSAGGSPTGGALFSDISNYDTLFYRYYVKYGPGFDGATNHSGVWGGGRLTSNGFPWGEASFKPTEKHWILIQPWASNRIDFYGYFPNMGCITDPTLCWGNSFIQDAGLVYEADAWHLVEFMVKMNSPTSSTNGELRLWYDGVEIIHYGDGFPNATRETGNWTPGSGSPFPGFEWTTAAAAHSNNMVWVELYQPAGTVNMSIDDLVVATEYIGPIASIASTPTFQGVTLSLYERIKLMFKTTGRAWAEAW